MPLLSVSHAMKVLYGKPLCSEEQIWSCSATSLAVISIPLKLSARERYSRHGDGRGERRER